MAIKSEIKKLEKQLSLYKSVEKDNARFNKMSKAKKRITIAEDVIASLKINKYTATPGSYLEVQTNKDYDSLPGDSQALLHTEEVSCDVCAIGAIFASKVRKGSKCNYDLLNGDNDSLLIANLKGIFNEIELRIIETAFEGEAQSGLVKEADEEAAVSWYGKNHPDDADKRLVAIMKNIIKNNGNFIP